MFHVLSWQVVDWRSRRATLYIQVIQVFNQYVRLRYFEFGVRAIEVLEPQCSGLQNAVCFPYEFLESWLMFMFSKRSIRPYSTFGERSRA